MSGPVFLHRKIVERLHEMQIERFGGAYGLRDEGILESALARPINKAAYGCEDLMELAAAYLYGLVKNHAFIDGNKRIAIVAAAVFLMENGWEIDADEGQLYAFVLSVAAGDIDEEGATRFFRDFCVPFK